MIQVSAAKYDTHLALNEIKDFFSFSEPENVAIILEAPRDEWIVGVEIAAWKKGHYDLGYEISQIDDEIPAPHSQTLLVSSTASGMYRFRLIPVTDCEWHHGQPG